MIKFCAWFILLSPGIVAGQSPTAAVARDRQAPTYSTRTTLVLIPALVTTRSGEPVFTLRADDFTVTDDGVEQKVTLEEDTGDQPLALMVAIETGGAGGRRLDNYRKLEPLIEAMIGNVQHRIALVAFDSEAELLQDFTPDMKVVQSALDGLKPGNGGAAILDGLALSVAALREQPPGYRRAILLLSETVDHGSKVKLAEALRVISDTNTAIYSLAFSTTKAEIRHEASQLSQPHTPGPPGGCMSKDPDKDPDSDPDPTDNRWTQAWDCLSLLAPPLRAAKIAALAGMNSLRRNVPETVAELTGGEFYRYENARSLERGLLTLRNHLPNRYMLSFHPQSPHPGLHTLQCRLREYPNLDVKARSSYWADDASTTAPHP